MIQNIFWAGTVTVASIPIQILIILPSWGSISVSAVKSGSRSTKFKAIDPDPNQTERIQYHWTVGRSDFFRKERTLAICCAKLFKVLIFKMLLFASRKALENFDFYATLSQTLYFHVCSDISLRNVCGFSWKVYNFQGR